MASTFIRRDVGAQGRRADPDRRRFAPVPPLGTDDAATARGSLTFFVFCLYTFVLVGRPQDYWPALVPFRVVLVLTVLTCLMTFFERSGEPGSLLRQTETKIYLCFFLIMCMGIPFSIYRRKSFDAVVLGYLGNLIFFGLFVIHVNTAARFRRIVQVLMIAAFLFSVAGFVQGRFTNGRYLTGSEMFDPNDVAFVEVSLLAFSVCVLVGYYGKLWKALALGSVMLGVLLALYTGSRGGLIGLLTFLLLLFAIRIPKVKKWHKLVLLVMLAGATVANASKINIERYLTLMDMEDDYNLSDEFGRSQLWTRGFQLFLEDPLTGVGVSGFGESIGTMRGEENKVARWQDPHNSFIQVLTETGVFGIGAFIWLIVVCGKTFYSSRRKADALVERQLELMPAILLGGFIAQLVTASFLTQGYSILLTLFFAVAASFRQVSGAVTQAPTHAPLPAAGRPLHGR